MRFSIKDRLAPFKGRYSFQSKYIFDDQKKHERFLELLGIPFIELKYCFAHGIITDIQRTATLYRKSPQNDPEERFGIYIRNPKTKTIEVVVLYGTSNIIHSYISYWKNNMTELYLLQLDES